MRLETTTLETEKHEAGFSLASAAGPGPEAHVCQRFSGYLAKCSPVYNGAHSGILRLGATSCLSSDLFELLAGTPSTFWQARGRLVVKYGRSKARRRDVTP